MIEINRYLLSNDQGQTVESEGNSTGSFPACSSIWLMVGRTLQETRETRNGIWGQIVQVDHLCGGGYVLVFSRGIPVGES